MRIVKTAGAVFGVLGAQKSFAANPIIGSHRLNLWGLHRRRVAVAARMTRFRRALMWDVPGDVKADYARDGVVMREDFLPPDDFKRLREEAFERPHHAFDQRQGGAVTRLAPIFPGGTAPLAARAVRSKPIRSALNYLAGRGGVSSNFIQAIFVEPDGAPDPQTRLHADTFHATSKFWLTLEDVALEDGPFGYVFGSHRLTPERLAWEYEQSVFATTEEGRAQRHGSFRIDVDALEAMGFAPERPLPAPANTPIVADTFGFHRRIPAARPGTRVALYGYLRRGPFPPWNGLHGIGLPGLRGREFMLRQDLMAMLGRKPRLADAGTVPILSPSAV